MIFTVIHGASRADFKAQSSIKLATRPIITSAGHTCTLESVPQVQSARGQSSWRANRSRISKPLSSFLGSATLEASCMFLEAVDPIQMYPHSIALEWHNRDFRHNRPGIAMVAITQCSLNGALAGMIFCFHYSSVTTQSCKTITMAPRGFGFSL